ncbi:hypothetical protein N7541_002985 [Penicillium brevicompactum]|uniref:HNH nuclease domain-containing protein n=1 Tax=Penicillium brevicompactum TaxID=5074 RepID=A0A9W9V0Z0_PENBR|nr:hypothetical protein N7541_002985 [Penicillium brevicompactum]
MENQHFLTEFEDPVRQFLIAQINQNEDELELLRRRFYALWFADIEMLVKWSSSDEKAMRFRGIKLARDPPLFNIPSLCKYQLRCMPSALAHTHINTFDPKLGINEEQADRTDDRIPTEPEYLSDHDQVQARLDYQLTEGVHGQARARDHNTCLLTGHRVPMIESAHIIPALLNGHPAEETYYCLAWMKLEIWWSKSKVREWKRQLEEGDSVNTEKVYNLMTLDSQVKEYWDRGLIAFRPIRVNQDQTEMQIAFHWLPSEESLGDICRDDSMPLENNSFEGPEYQGDQHEGPEGDEAIFHAETGKNIYSGHIFTVRTDDKKHRPLPSFELLEMRWHLSRIAAMSGYESPDFEYYKWSDSD